MSIISRTFPATIATVFFAGIFAVNNICIADETNAEDVIAVVNGEKLTKNEFESYISIRIGQQHRLDTLNEGQRKALLDEFINRELIYQDAVANGLDKIPGVAEEIENQRHNILASYSVRRIISKPPTNEAMRNAYKEQYADKNTEYNAKHILVKTEDEAKAVIAALDNGEDFSKLAAEKSLDSSGKEGGDIGWFSLEQMVKPFGDAAAGLKKGEYTKVPVQTKFGWHVIKLENTREVGPPPFDTVRDELRNTLQNQMINDYVVQLRNDAKIDMK